MSKKTLTIVCSNQFGYLTDTFQYCNALRDRYDIHYICIDFGNDKLDLLGVRVSYLSTQRAGIRKWIDFLRFAKKEISNDSDIIFIKYFSLCSLLLSNVDRDKAVCDVRSGSVRLRKWARLVENALMSCETKLFKKVTIISHSLAKLLRIKDYTLLPLGTADFGVRESLSVDKIRLVYVGTLSLRRLEDTVLGLKKYIDHFGRECIGGYDIVGDGNGNELEELNKLIVRCGLSDVIECHGRVPNTEIKKYLHRANIGVSYVPITPFYNVQPVTKSFEYLSTGMPVLGTATLEQRLVITDSSLGQLCEDNSDSFYESLEKIVKEFHRYDPKVISNAVKGMYWCDVCSNLDQNILSVVSE